MGGSELQEAPSKEALTNINGQEKVEVRHSMIIGDEIWIMCEGETAHLKKINSCISLALSGSSSGGVHESDDLDDIYDIQNGCCYFTGKPILSGKSDALIFHLKPLDCGGDHWPGNIIYVSKEINQDKHFMAAAQYWRLLEKMHGTEWVKERKKVTRKFDVKRRAVSRKRKRKVEYDLKLLEGALSANYPGEYISLELCDDGVEMRVNGTISQLQNDFLRNKITFKSIEYYNGIIRSILRPKHEEIIASEHGVQQVNNAPVAPLAV
ncbi:MAG: hypothetical protein RPU52_02580 [Candidatus Sedimenticola sp. (ex Thyasira tokunagai)]